MNWLALILFSIVPQDDGVLRERVDLAEVNSFYDDEVRLVFVQVIFYDFDWKAKRYQVREWRLIKDGAVIPRKDWEGGLYSSFWQDGQNTRSVSAESVRETWTQYDPELLEREALATEKRIPLRQPVKKARIRSPNGGDECSSQTSQTPP